MSNQYFEREVLVDMIREQSPAHRIFEGLFKCSLESKPVIQSTLSVGGLVRDTFLNQTEQSEGKDHAE